MVLDGSDRSHVKLMEKLAGFKADSKLVDLIKKSEIFGNENNIEETVCRFNLQRAAKNLLKASSAPTASFSLVVPTTPKSLIERLLTAVD